MMQKKIKRNVNYENAFNRNPQSVILKNSRFPSVSLLHLFRYFKVIHRAKRSIAKRVGFQIKDVHQRHSE